MCSAHHSGKASKKRIREPKATKNCCAAVTRELFESGQNLMWKIEWRRKTDKYEGKANFSEKETGFPKRSMETCLQGIEE